MKQYLFYGCDYMYERGPLKLLKSIYVSDDVNTAPSSETTAQDYKNHFKKLFVQEEYSALYILVLDLDPTNGVTSVICNEYAENPLKKRIIINATARPKISKPKRETILDAYHEQVVVAGNAQ